jgi:transcriptional regulator with XRE-family HTH domain
LRVRSPKPLSKDYPKVISSLADYLRKKRLDLGLLQKEVAARIGVDPDSICNWERQRNIPEIRFMPKIIDFLGYCPLVPAGSFIEQMIRCRTALGLSQRAFSKVLRVDPTTLGGWESGRQRPTKRSEKVLRTFLKFSIG